jgi:alpha-galactosidase
VIYVIASLGGYCRYTAKGPNTCAGFAASCNHEAQDALQWATWGKCAGSIVIWSNELPLGAARLFVSPGIDYVKDDSCSNCVGPNGETRSDDDLYHSMWLAIEDSGREMVLTVEGAPDNTLMTAGGLGNAKRVGHDISPQWGSMLSLVDIGSGLWPFAHNSTNATFGGFWNDLDMIEIGNAPDFVCSQDAASLTRCQTHFT